MTDSNTIGCGPTNQVGRYALGEEDELIVVSFPGPPRSSDDIITDVPAHMLGAPTLVPIVTVTNEAGAIDVVVEAFPNEHRFNDTDPGVQAGIILPDDQPQVEVCNTGPLLNGIRFAPVGQPGLDRTPPEGTTVRVEARPIYSVGLATGQSTTVYAAAPGSWIRLRGRVDGSRGAYCFSWCCPPSGSGSMSGAGTGSGGTQPPKHEPPPKYDPPPYPDPYVGDPQPE